MNTSEQIIKVIDNLCKKFGIAIDWTNENILPYIQQLGHKIIMYDLWTSIVWVIMGGIFFGIAFLLIISLKKKREEAMKKVSLISFFIGMVILN